MADAVVTQVYDGEHNVVVTLENLSDGTGQTNVVVLDATSYTPGAITKFCLNKCSYNIKGGAVVIYWDAPTRRALLFMGDSGPGMSHRDFSRWGGLRNDVALLDSTGDVLLTTYGFALNSSYSITLEFKKVGVRAISYSATTITTSSNHIVFTSSHVIVT